MDRERFKSLRIKFTIIAGVVWLMLFAKISSQERAWYDPTDAIFLLTFGIPFVVGHFVAKSVARNEYEKKATEKINENERLREKQRAAEIDAYRQSKLSTNRAFILGRLGFANNCIDLLSDPAYQDRKTLTKQSIADELNAIIATIPLIDLKEIITANQEIQIKIRKLNTRLKEHSIEDANVAIMLEAITSGGPPVPEPSSAPKQSENFLGDYG